MTERLYYTDAYLTDFEASVLEAADGGRRVYLDRTAFYPTSGGQPNDLGTLGGIDVVDVVDEDDRVAHLLAAALPSGARTVSGNIDWARRHDHMQQHTGQHLLSAVFDDRFGHRTVSVHFGRETSTLDLDTESVPPEQVLAAEARANELVGAARPVTVTFEDAASVSGLRKPSERGGTLRVVTLDGVDRSACGGTHVRTTAEIGPILVRRLEKVRRATRVEFVCGQRAVRRARADFEALGAVSRALTVAPDEAPPAVSAMAAQLRDAASARKKLEDELRRRDAEQRYHAAAPDARGVRRVVERLPADAATADELRARAQAFGGLVGAIYVGALEAPPFVVVAAADGTGADAGALIKALAAELGGRGGGSPRMAQLTLPDPALAARAADLILERLP